MTKEMTELLSIAPLEFLALLGSMFVFGSTLPTPTVDCKYTILMQSDSVTSTWKLQAQHGSSLVMIYILDQVMKCSEFNRLKRVMALGHVFGEGNPMADNLSRGDMTLFFRTCNLLRVKPRKLEVPSAFKHIVRQVCDYAKTLPSRAP